MLNVDDLMPLPTRIGSLMGHNSSFDHMVYIAIRVVLVGALVAGLRSAATWLSANLGRGKLRTAQALLTLDSSLPDCIHRSV
jgi:hypothetical protein